MPVAEPMNASPYHPKVKASLTLADKTFLAGSHVGGKLELEARADSGLGLGLIMVELVAIQELTSRDHSATTTFLHLRRLFQGPGLPPSNAVVPIPDPKSPPLPAGHYLARRGITTFLFGFDIPLASPGSISFGGGIANVRYEVRATVGVAWKGERKLVTDRKIIEVVEDFDESCDPPRNDIVAVGDNGKIWMRAHLVGDIAVIGESACVELEVKNHSPKKTSSLSMALARHLELPPPPGSEGDAGPPLHISDVLTSANFKGPEYTVPPGGEGVARLVLDIPPSARAVSAPGIFQVPAILNIKLGMGLTSKSITLDLPVRLVHPLALPPLEEPYPLSSPIPSPPPISLPTSPAPLFSPPRSPVMYSPPPAVSPPPFGHHPLPYSPIGQPQLYYTPPPPGVGYMQGMGMIYPAPCLPSGVHPAALRVASPPSGLPIVSSLLQQQPVPLPLMQASMSVPGASSIPLSLSQQHLPPPPPPARATRRASIEVGETASIIRKREEQQEQERQQQEKGRISLSSSSLQPTTSLPPRRNSLPGPVATTTTVVAAEAEVPTAPLDMPAPPPRNMHIPLPMSTTPTLHSPQPMPSPKKVYSSDPLAHASLEKSERVEVLERIADVVGKGDLSGDPELMASSPSPPARAGPSLRQGEGEPIPVDGVGADAGAGAERETNGNIVSANANTDDGSSRDNAVDGDVNINKTLPGIPLASVKTKLFDGHRDRERHHDQSLRAPLSSDILDEFPAVPVAVDDGLSALERRLLLEVGTRKAAQAPRPDVRTMLLDLSSPASAPLLTADGDANKQEEGEGSARPTLRIDMPRLFAGVFASNTQHGHDDGDNNRDADTVISPQDIASLANNSLNMDPVPFSPAVDMAVSAPIPITGINPKGEESVISSLTLGGADGTEFGGETEKHLGGGNASGREDEDGEGDIPPLPPLPEAVRRKKSNDGSGGKKKDKVKLSKDQKANETHEMRKAAKGRVAAWLGRIDPMVPPETPTQSPGRSVKALPLSSPQSPAAALPPDMAAAIGATVEVSQRVVDDVLPSPAPLMMPSLPPLADGQGEQDSMGVEEMSHAEAAPNPRSSGFMPISTLRGLPLPQEARRSRFRAPPAPTTQVISEEAAPASSSNAATNGVTVAPTQQSSVDVHVNGRASPDDSSTLSATTEEFPAKAAPKLPVPLSSPNLIDLGVKYDVRSARGGRGGQVTAVASIWATKTATSQPDSDKSKPNKALDKPPVPLVAKRHHQFPSAHMPGLSNGDRTPQADKSRAAVHGIRRPAPATTQNNLRAPRAVTPSKSPSPPTTTGQRTPTVPVQRALSSSNNSPLSGDLMAKRARLIKSPSVPAVVSASFATPTLSSTASLARPPVVVTKMAARSLQPPLVSTTDVFGTSHPHNQSSNNVGSKPATAAPVGVGVGQARLRDLIKKYQE